MVAWIEDYNTKRRHSACQMMPPARYEQVLAAREAGLVQVVPPRA